jgi:predicted AAA+ superfamily ATPase
MTNSHVMRRDIYHKLQSWKLSTWRKPLLLQGARQTGKTFILKELGHREYANTVYCNFEEDPSLNSFFQRDLNPQRILNELSVYKDLEIRPETDLIIFDEIQVSNLALNSLKYFAEQKKDVHIVAAGSLLGVKMSRPGSFPVGKVNFLQLYPMTFMEFLDAIGETRYRKILEDVDAFIPLTKAFHLHLIDLLHTYFFVGGMPEAVKNFAAGGKGLEVREIQTEIIKSYVLDFAKHAPAVDIPKLSLVWESIPRHLAKENKKFVFSALKKGARGRSYENAIKWLEDAGLIHRAYATKTAKKPLKHYVDTGCFKAYSLDVGLLGAIAGSPVESLVQRRLFNEYEGAFVENYVAQQLISDFRQSLFYWRSKGGRAELDFLCEITDQIYPIEVKAGINPKSKSLKSFDLQFSPSLLIRTNLLNLKKDGKICNFPLYSVSCIPRLLGISD